MKIKLLLALTLGVSLAASAQGYKDGIEYYKAGQYDNAITLLQRNLNDASTDKALSQYYLGQAYLAKKDNAKAKECFDKGIAANPDCAYNYVGLGSIELQKGNTAAAKDLFKKAQSLAKKNHEVTVDIARAYFNNNPEAKEVDEFLTKAHKASKNQEPSIYILEGDRLAKKQDWNSAATQYEQAIYFDEDNPEGYVKYANVYFNLNPDYAISKLNELLEKKPNSALAQRELAEKYYRADKWTRAAQQYGKYIANPNHFPEDKARYTVLLYAGNDYDKAIAVGREVLAQEPENFQVQRVIVRSLADLKDYENALAESNKLLEAPAFAGRHNASDMTTHASILRKTGQDSLALVTLENALATYPGNTGVLYDLSDFYFDQKDYPKSADFVEAYLNAEQEPGRSELYGGAINFLGATSAKAGAGDLEAAANYAHRGMALIDRATQGLELSQIPASWLRRKALLSITGNNSIANEESVAILNQLLERLEMNPEYVDPNNEDNRLSYYVEIYRYLTQYNNDQKNIDAAAQTKERMDYYQSLLDQVPAK